MSIETETDLTVGNLDVASAPGQEGTGRSHLDARIVIVGDDPHNVRMLDALLAGDGYTHVTATTDSAEAVALCASTPPDLLVLDLEMPEPDGFAVMEELGPRFATGRIPILTLADAADATTKERALAAGAKDIVARPFDELDVLVHIRNLLEVRFLHLELRRQSLGLEEMVRSRTDDLNVARLEVLSRLALAAEYRDDETGEHAQRVGRTAALLAGVLDLGGDVVGMIRHAAPLHDVGKMGIPDRLLLKKGKLTQAEFELMQHHVRIGQRILARSRSPLLRMAEHIALTHHERWNGNGYMQGLAGEEIPLSGRIAAVADVFDALTHDRPYKKAWPVDRAVKEIVDQSGQQFDPQVVEAFVTLDHAALLAPVAVGAGG